MLQSLIQRFQRSHIVRPFNTPTAFLFRVITSQLLGEVYYMLYDNLYEMPSRVAFDPEEPSLGCIRVDSVTPPHSPTSIKRCISRVEGNPALVLNTDLFGDSHSLVILIVVYQASLESNINSDQRPLVVRLSVLAFSKFSSHLENTGHRSLMPN